MSSKKQVWKKIDKKCAICNEDNSCLLDSHRIIPGADAGKYTRDNTLTVCVSCHRKIHSGFINILKKRPSTGGEVVHYIENNEEKFNFL